MSKSNKALVVFSGGQDSTTCLGYALHNYEEVHAITFDYGQKHRRELEAAMRVLAYFEDHYHRVIPHEIVTFPAGMFHGSSPLTSPVEQLETYSDYDTMEQVIGNRVEKTFVPMRNAAFLITAANRAAVAGIDNIITGVCEADNANYPDCRHVFISEIQSAINLALGNDLSDDRMIKIVTPLMRLSKCATVLLADSLPHTYAALAYSHTAYDGNYPPTGKDHASILRAKGFEEANLPDPLVMRAWIDGLMALPDSANYDEIRGMSKTEAFRWLLRHSPTPR